MTKQSIYETITNKIIAQLEAIESSSTKWDKPWFSIGVAPYNAISKKTYRGINHLVLGMNDYQSRAYATFNQWKEKGCMVRKGMKGHQVVLWKFSDNQDSETGDITKSVFTTSYVVFNSEQVDGDFAREIESKPLRSLNDHTAISDAEQFIQHYLLNERLKTKHDDRAYYSHSLSGEHIGMPLLGQFKTPQEYYSTFLHEIAHSTGHERRLNRDMTGGFGSKKYAAEELVAELSAAFLCGTLGISNTPREDHAVYLKSWLQALKEDKKAIFTAASKAQKACDFIHASVNNYAEFLGMKAESIDTVIMPETIPEAVQPMPSDLHPLIIAQQKRLAMTDKDRKAKGMVKRAGMWLWPTQNIKPNGPVTYSAKCPKLMESQYKQWKESHAN